MGPKMKSEDVQGISNVAFDEDHDTAVALVDAPANNEDSSTKAQHHIFFISLFYFGKLMVFRKRLGNKRKGHVGKSYWISHVLHLPFSWTGQHLALSIYRGTIIDNLFHIYQKTLTHFHSSVWKWRGTVRNRVRGCSSSHRETSLLSWNDSWPVQ